MLRGTRAAQVLIGMLVIFIAYAFSSILQFETLHWIISKFYSSFIMVVIVLFQDDIRRLLSRFGKGPFFSRIEVVSGGLVLDEIINAAKALSHERIGALIVFERSIGLDKLYDHSVQLNALVSEQLLMSIFQSFSPLHDGAVIVQKNRISCASAQLPLSKNPLFSKKMGTRHSAAVGISEETDAVVLVVSEETGSISIAWEGNLQRQSSPDAALKMLRVLLLPKGERNHFFTWMEEHIFFHTNKLYLYAQKFFFAKQRHNIPGGVDRRRRGDLRHQRSSAPAYIVERLREESDPSLDMLVRFSTPQSSKQVMMASQSLVVAGAGLASVGAALPGADMLLSQDDHLQQEPASNASPSDLAPEERFNPPPVPKTIAPRDVEIGGVSLNPPLDHTSQTPFDKDKRN